MNDLIKQRFELPARISIRKAAHGVHIERPGDVLKRWVNLFPLATNGSQETVLKRTNSKFFIGRLTPSSELRTARHELPTLRGFVPGPGNAALKLYLGRDAELDHRQQELTAVCLKFCGGLERCAPARKNGFQCRDGAVNGQLAA